MICPKPYCIYSRGIISGLYRDIASFQEPICLGLRVYSVGLGFRARSFRVRVNASCAPTLALRGKKGGFHVAAVVASMDCTDSFQATDLHSDPIESNHFPVHLNST